MILDFNTIISKYNLKINGVLHIGAHYGQEYKLYKSVNISNLIFFEPLKDNFNILKTTVGNECILHNIALGNKSGFVEMFVETDNYGMSSSILEPKLHITQYPFIEFNKREMVEIKKLDDITFNKTNLNESQKLNIQQEMKNLMGDILESNKKVKQLMKQKGYEI